jgi:hypothetical protein
VSGTPRLYETHGGRLIAATTERNARRIVREHFEISRSWPLKEVSPHKRIKMTADGEHIYTLSAREVAEQFCPGVVPEDS